MKILITSFEPFGGESINPASEAVKILPEKIEEAEIIKLQLPVKFIKSAEVLEKAVEDYRPDVILSIGQAGGRAGLTVEKVAINYAEGISSIEDDSCITDSIIYEKGENAYFSTLPVKAMVRKIREADIPASVSFTAGTYVCNYIMYTELYLNASLYKNMKCGFIHVPFAPKQAVGKNINTPTMSIECIAKGIEEAVKAIIEFKEDIVSAEGVTN